MIKQRWFFSDCFRVSFHKSTKEKYKLEMFSNMRPIFCHFNLAKLATNYKFAKWKWCKFLLPLFYYSEKKDRRKAFWKCLSWYKLHYPFQANLCSSLLIYFLTSKEGKKKILNDWKKADVTNILKKGEILPPKDPFM